MNKKTVVSMTRVSGDGRINLFYDTEGRFKNSYVQAAQLRGFEEIARKRPIEEIPGVVSRICGRCCWHHYLAAEQASDLIQGVVRSGSSGRFLNDLAHLSEGLSTYYCASLPDIAGAKDAASCMEKIGKETYKDAFRIRARAQRILSRYGGSGIHPASSRMGKVSKQDASKMAKELRDFLSFAEFNFDLFEELALKNRAYNPLVPDRPDHLETYYMSLAGEKGELELYSGKIIAVGPGGGKKHLFKKENYQSYISEHVESWTYATYPYLKKVGWKGFVDGEKSGVYRTGPLARYNTSKRIRTEKAQDAYLRIKDLAGKPCHDNFIGYAARLAELIYSCEDAIGLLDSGLEDAIEEKEPLREGVGAIESGDGLILHHYSVGPDLTVKKANILTGTNQNNAAIHMSARRAAKNLRYGKEASELEKVLREYTPCMFCASH